MVCQSQKLQSPVLVLAAETVLQRWEGTALPLNLRTSSYQRHLPYYQWKWALPGFGVVGNPECGGDIHPTPRAAMGDYGILCKMALQELAASQLGPLSLFFCSVLSLESGLLISSKCLLGNLFLGKRISLNFFKFHIVLDC